MGLAGLGAVLLLVFALLAQSPGTARRVGFDATRLALRARALTGYALALLLLALGFFVAGVPLESGATSVATGPQPTAVATAPESGAMPAPPTDTGPELAVSPTAGTPVSGAFSGPPARPSATETATLDAALAPPTATPTPPATGAGGTPAPTATPAATATATRTPTATPTPTPTTTPSPTLTPTPISGETAVVRPNASTTWLRRTPGGGLVVQVDNGDTVVLLPRRASFGGAIWQEVSTLDGVAGWIREDLLAPAES